MWLVFKEKYGTLDFAVLKVAASTTTTFDDTFEPSCGLAASSILTSLDAASELSVAMTLQSAGLACSEQFLSRTILPLTNSARQEI